MIGFVRFGGFGLRGDACGIKALNLVNTLSSNLKFVGGSILKQNGL